MSKETSKIPYMKQSTDIKHKVAVNNKTAMLTLNCHTQIYSLIFGKAEQRKFILAIQLSACLFLVLSSYYSTAQEKKVGQASRVSVAHRNIILTINLVTLKGSVLLNASSVSK